MSVTNTTCGPAEEGGWFPRGEFNCPVREVLDRIGDKWSLLVMTRLGAGTRRFGDLLREVDSISQRMLTRTLRSLERDGLVLRIDHHEVPPRVEYELTPLGETLREPVEALAAWAAQHRPNIRESRRRYDQTAFS
jgi:DNA-binding HxlR family transcriptional regulator